MGQKVHPTGIRLGIVKDWSSKWYATTKDYSKNLAQDLAVRKLLGDRLKEASVSKILIERPARNAKITISTARPGVIIGKNGKDIDLLRAEIGKMIGVPVHLNIEEVRKPDLDAKLVADSIASQLTRRIAFRRAMKRAVANALRAGAKGVKICVGGRLGGAEIARSEWYREGRVPLHTFRADIDYGTSEALTTYGIIGVKVWIFRGEVLGEKETPPVEETRPKVKKKGRREE